MPINKDLLREILEDLPDLYREHPTGVTLRDLNDWYGEANAKLAKVIQEMADLHLIDLRRGPQNTFILFPKGKGPQHEEIKLTPLQDHLLGTLRIAYSEKARPLKTNYARLAQCCKSSYGGIRAAVQKLNDLRLITIEHQSERGHQDQLIITVTPLPKARIHEDNIVRFDQVSRRIQRG